MIKEAAKYHEIFRITLSNTFAYAMELVMKSLFLVIILFIFAHLWKAVYGTGENAIEGFTLKDMLWYFMFTECMILSRGRPESKIDSEVKSGNIAYTLNKPYNYLIFQLFLWMGESLPQFITNFLTGSIMAYLMVGPIKINLLILFPLIIIILLGSVMEFFIRMSIGLSAFWFEDINMASFIYTKIVFIFGGMLLPFEFFPPLLKKIAESLPFGYMVYHPAKLFVKFNWLHCIEAAKMQILWILILWGICYFIYSLGLRRLNINGG